MANAATGVIASNSCGGFLTALSNGTSFALSNGTIPANHSCAIHINVVGTSVGSSTNHTGAVTSANASPGADASATLTVTNGALLAAPRVSKSFAPTSVLVGGFSQMTITLANTDPLNTITGAQFNDLYPAGMANAPNNVVVSNTCGGAPFGSNISIQLNNATIPAGGSCSIVVNIVGAAVGSWTNQTGAVLSGNAQTGSSASATLTVTNGALLAAPTVTKAFAPASMVFGDTSQMTITLTNPNASTIAGAQFADNYPAGMANVPNGVVVSNTCGGTLTAAANDISTALVNGTIPANGNCSVIVNVLGTSVGTFDNSTGLIKSANAQSGGPSIAPLTVTSNPALLAAPMVSKAFSPATVMTGGTSQMTITLTNADLINDVTGVQFTDVYPTNPVGMANAPNGVVVGNSCGGTVTAAANGSSMSLTNGTIPADFHCSVVINVVATAVSGAYVNHTGAVSSANANGGTDALATLTITNGNLLSAPTVTKAFAPASVAVGSASQMTITLSNSDPNTAISSAQFTDAYPPGMANAASGVIASNTCGGFVTAAANSSSTSLANGTIPPGGSCSVVINVVGTSAGSSVNHTGALSSANANVGADATATLTVTGGLLAAPTVTKAFAPASVVIGGTSQMTITLVNSNPNTAITGAQFTDSYPAGMANASSSVVTSNSCGGVVTAATNGNSIALANGTIPANGNCSVVVNVIGTSTGSSINHTGAVTSTNASAGSDASAILTVTNGALLPAPTVTKGFAPASVSLGGTSQMTISLSNNDPNNAVLGAQFTDSYPPGMANAASGAVVSNSCGGTVTAAANSASAALMNGTIPAGGTCNIVINVVGTSVGNSVNHTGSVMSSNAQIGADASATLVTSNIQILNAPTVTKAFAPPSVKVGGTTQMKITLTNSDPANAITAVQFNDSYPFGMANASNGAIVQ